MNHVYFVSLFGKNICFRISRQMHDDIQQMPKIVGIEVGLGGIKCSPYIQISYDTHEIAQTEFSFISGLGN